MNERDQENVRTVVDVFCGEILEAAIWFPKRPSWGRAATREPRTRQERKATLEAFDRLQDAFHYFERNILPHAGCPNADALFGEDAVVLEVDLRKERPIMVVFILRHPDARPPDMPIGQAHFTWQRLRDKCVAKGLDRGWFNSHVLFQN